MAQKHPTTDRFAELTWTDLQEWAGSSTVARGRSYQRNRQVQELVCTPSGSLLAWVQGTQRYATQVDIAGSSLTSSCTCPVGYSCKHAVATVLDYLERLKQNINVPTVPESDRRLTLLQEDTAEDAWSDEDEEESAETVHHTPQEHSKRSTAALHSYLEQQTKAQLMALLEELAEHYPDVRESMLDRRDLAMGSVKELVKQARQEIDHLSAEPGWSHHWDDAEYTPDYSRVQDRLQALLDKGYADEVIALGKPLLEAGTQQVEMSHDEGEAAEAIASCLTVVFRALARSSLAPAEQMLWAVEAELDDEYDLCQAAEQFWEQEYAAADWHILAEKLAQRLRQCKSTPGNDRFLRNYHRDRLTDWLIYALEHAGRHDEIIPLCEHEAEETGSYVRLVQRLKADNRWEEAEQWIHKGINATQKHLPGIASELRTALRDIHEKENDWLQVAAMHADDFFQHPTLQAFQESQKAAERADVWPAVRSGAMYYLETGKFPQPSQRAAKDRTIPPWPLPASGLTDHTDRQHLRFPIIDTLIAIAIAEKRPDEILRWYDQRQPGGGGWGWGGIRDDQIAETIAQSYPERALDIWKKLAEACIAQTQTRAYEQASAYLRKQRDLLKQLGRTREWQSYLTDLRQANVRKKRLLELLDDLEGLRIVDRQPSTGQKATTAPAPIKSPKR
ncbi:MAG: SWIM zinc finger family protein [Candidatus Entotheonellia bacterium]